MGGGGGDGCGDELITFNHGKQDKITVIIGDAGLVISQNADLSRPSDASVNYVIINSDNGMSPVWRQDILQTNDDFMLIGPMGTTFSEIRIEIQRFSL